MKKYLILVAFLSVNGPVDAVEPADAAEIFQKCIEPAPRAGGEALRCRSICLQRYNHYMQGFVKHNDPLCAAAPQTPHGCYCKK